MSDKQKEYWDTTKQDPLVKEVLNYKKQGVVLDLGAGTGKDAIFLAEQGFSVTTVDNDEIHHAGLARKIRDQKLPIHQVLTDVHDYQPAASFDIIICNMVLHFFDPQEIKKLIANMQLWTNVGGINILIAYSDKNEPGKRPYLFKHNELVSYYTKWEVISYEEKPTPWFQLPNEDKPRRNHASYLLARKLQ